MIIDNCFDHRTDIVVASRQSQFHHLYLQQFLCNHIVEEFLFLDGANCLQLASGYASEDLLSPNIGIYSCINYGLLTRQ